MLPALPRLRATSQQERAANPGVTFRVGLIRTLFAPFCFRIPLHLGFVPPGAPAAISVPTSSLHLEPTLTQYSSFRSSTTVNTADDDGETIEAFSGCCRSCISGRDRVYRSRGASCHPTVFVSVLCVAFKTLTISEEAHQRLKKHKLSLFWCLP